MHQKEQTQDKSIFQFHNHINIIGNGLYFNALYCRCMFNFEKIETVDKELMYDIKLLFSKV